MSKILVTGSEGSLMQEVISQMLNGVEIIGVDNLSRHNGKRMDGAKDLPYQFILGDLTNSTFVNHLMAEIQPDYIINGAATIFGVGGFNRHCAEILSRDVILQANLLDAARRWEVERFIYISSSMVYETMKVNRPVEEEDIALLTPPKTDYGLSKYMGERLCKSYHAQYGMPYTIWRPFNIITPKEIGESVQGNSHVFADLIENIVIEKKNPVPILGDGEQIRCYTNIREVATAIKKYSFDKASENEDFNICNNEPYSVIELANTIHEVSKEFFSGQNEPLKFEHLPAFKNDVRYRVASSNKLFRTFGFRPIVETKQSVKECLEYRYRKVKW